MEIRGFTIKYSKNKAKKRKSAEIYFQNKINELYKKAEKHPNNKQIINEIYYTRSHLKNIMQHKTKGTILRSKVRWHEHGERNTRYFYGLEKRNYEFTFSREFTLNSSHVPGTFKYHASRVFNTLPSTVRSSKDNHEFRRLSTAHYVSNAVNRLTEQ